MAFAADWSNSIIVDHTKLNAVAAGMRAIRTAVSDRLATIVSGFVSGETVLGILNLPFIAVSAPSIATDQIQLYGKVVGGKTLLHTKDEDGTEGQLVPLRTGDKLLSSNTTTPPDFTDQSSTYADKFIRISSTALSTGGADTHTHAAGSYAGPAHTHAVSGLSLIPFAGGGGIDYYSPRASSHTSDSGGTGAVTGTSASGDNVPAYVTLKIYSKN